MRAYMFSVSVYCLLFQLEVVCITLILAWTISHYLLFYEVSSQEASACINLTIFLPYR